VSTAAPSDRRSLLASLHQRAGMLAIRIADAMRPPLSLGVRLVAFDDRERVFLVRHSYLPGLHLPGGAVDAEETCREAAVREAREEGGLDFAAPPELFHIYRNGAGGRRDHVVLFVVRDARQARPKRPSLEILAADFHPLDRLPDDLTPATRRRLDEVLAGRRPEDSW
jgi:ADP-ribose pyrophosphatase YjhB (NUDIX family)